MTESNKFKKQRLLVVQFLSKIQPRYIIVVVLGIAVVMFTSAILELRQSRNDLFHLLQEHSLSLSETIANSSTNIVLSTDQIEQQLSERLLNNAYFIARLDSLDLLTEDDLRLITKQNNIFRINIFSKNGKRVLTNHVPEKHRLFLKEKHSAQDILYPILSGKKDVLIIGLKEARFEKGERYAVAVKRTKIGGGAIVLNLDAAQLVEFRKSIGIGKLIKDLGNNSGIEYVVLQDREGILVATSDVKEMSSLENDSTLASVFERDTIVTRQMYFHSREVFEVVHRLIIGNTAVGVLRIGLSMDEIRTIDERMYRRLVVMSIIVMVLGILIIAFLAASKNFNIVSRKYKNIQLLTGNILQQMHDAVVTVNAENVVTIFNKQAEELFGVYSSEILGKKFNELSADSQQCLKTIFEHQHPQFETTVHCSQGIDRIVSVTLSATKNADGMFESKTAVIKDLTETKRHEKEMRRKEKLTAMGELASGVAHEIRNPLNAISMIAQRYEKEFTPRSGVKEYRSLTAVLKKESARVNNIVQQFLKFARPPKITTKPISVVEFAQHISLLIEQETSAKKIKFNSLCEVDNHITIDHEQMTQALLNPLKNAIDATPTGGEISFSVYADNSNIVFEVKDSGNGISPESLEKIFNLYYTTKSNGNGLGLPITQQIVSQHHGTIDVQSEVGKGTIFTITIPKMNEV